MALCDLLYYSVAKNPKKVLMLLSDFDELFKDYGNMIVLIICKVYILKSSEGKRQVCYPNENAKEESILK